MRFHAAAVFSLGAFAIDAETRALCLDAGKALDAAGWKHAAAAVRMGISPQRLSLQLNAHELPTFLARATVLDGFWPALLRIHGKRLGLELFDNADVQRLLVGLGLIEKRMARMDLAARKEQVS